jgi:hypothetical protein
VLSLKLQSAVAEKEEEARDYEHGHFHANHTDCLPAVDDSSSAQAAFRLQGGYAHVIQLIFSMAGSFAAVPAASPEDEMALMGLLFVCGGERFA